MKKFFISTPIYYSSGKPHLGHAYTTILADVIARYKKAIGYDVFFVTGMDEHGQKISDKANELKKDINQMLEENANIFQDLWKKLDIDYSFFIRTTDDFHQKAVQKIFSSLLAKKYIYKGIWKGYYCVSCEENYNLSQAIKKDGKLYCKIGHELCCKNEESYFLATSKFQEWIFTYLKAHPEFIYPFFRSKELINNFLSEKLQDLSISRKEIKWGIEIKEDPSHVIYVWFDALFNYLTCLGYLSKNEQNFKKYWCDDNCEIVHLMSKEIIRFHCLYWPIMLHMLNLKLPTKIISHGWIINKDKKMSKSLKNVIDPHDYINEFGSDSLRYYLMKEISLSQDGVFNHQIFQETYNHDLANNYGNMTTRIAGMIKKYFANVVPNIFLDYLNQNDKKIIKIKNNLLNKYILLIEENKIQELLVEIQECYFALNKYIDEAKPWELFKNKKKEELANLLNISFNFNCVLITLLKPILVKTTKIVEKEFNLVFDFVNLKNNYHDLKINDCSPIFNRK